MTVIDADTKAPITDAVAIAHWEARTGGAYGEDGCKSIVAVEEGASDANGHLRLAAWGPRYAGCLAPPNFDSGRAPLIIIFKSGYDLWVEQNDVGSAERTSSFFGAVRTSIWDEKKVELKRFNGSPQQYAQRLGFLVSSLDYLFTTSGDSQGVRNSIPKMLAALNSQREQFDRENVQNHQLQP